MEASALQAPATLPQTRVVIGTPLLRFRSDEQLVAMFRAGHDEAFRVIHERYHKRLFAYARQMLPGRQDAEDALQDVFVRAYSGLRASDQELALRAWLFRVAHNRCIDELRRPAPPPPEVLQLVRATVHDPLVEVDLRESLRRLIEDIRRLPEQQRSALLMRELGGMSYADLGATLGISNGAVKSLLVRARVALAQAAAARDTSCLLIREQLVEAHDRGVRPNATARKHMRDCVGCKSFRRELRGMSRQLAALSPAIGPLAVLAKTLGFSGGAKSGAAGGGGLALLGGGGVTASAGGVAVGVNHLAALLVAAVATAGGAVEIQHTIISPAHHPAHARTVARRHHSASRGAVQAQPAAIQAIVGAVDATVSSAPKLAATVSPGAAPVKHRVHKVTAGGAGLTPSTGASGLSDPTESTDGVGTSTGADATGTGTGSSTSGAAACSGLLVSGPSTGTSPSSSSTTSSSPPAQSSTTTAPCVASSSSGTGTSSSGTSTSTSGSGSGSGAGTTANSGSSGASASGSGSGSSSASTASNGSSSTTAT